MLKNLLSSGRVEIGVQQLCYYVFFNWRIVEGYWLKKTSEIEIYYYYYYYFSVCKVIFIY